MPVAAHAVGSAVVHAVGSAVEVADSTAVAAAMVVAADTGKPGSVDKRPVCLAGGLFICVASVVSRKFIERQPQILRLRLPQKRGKLRSG
jgi:hypothetical protein